eukprot:scaffold170014_cov26-Tisochrysis_lutea.AAC.1
MPSRHRATISAPISSARKGSSRSALTTLASTIAAALAAALRSASGCSFHASTMTLTATPSIVLLKVILVAQQVTVCS